MHPSCDRRILFFVVLLLGSLCRSSSDTDKPSSYYYDVCAPSNCGKSLLRFPFGVNPLCRSAYMTTSCDNGTVVITDDESPETKYRLLEDINETVYARRSVKLVDISFFGCGPIPGYSSNDAQKWLNKGNLFWAPGYTIGTLFNCTEELKGDVLSMLSRAPCLDCGVTNNSCYFYDGYKDQIPNCRSFRVSIPDSVYSNLSGVKNLRRVLEEGFWVDWDATCGESCMDVTGGRCGYIEEERPKGDELCFCSSGVHKYNCSDGTNF